MDYFDCNYRVLHDYLDDVRYDKYVHWATLSRRECGKRRQSQPKEKSCSSSAEEESASRTDTSTPETTQKKAKDAKPVDVGGAARLSNTKRTCLHPGVMTQQISKSPRAKRILAELRQSSVSDSKRILPKRRRAAAVARGDSGTRGSEKNMWTFTRMQCSIL
jgi:hypothetical protein